MIISFDIDNTLIPYSDEFEVEDKNYAKLFGIDIHIDDSKGVGMEGEKYGFETIIIDTNDQEWVGKVLTRIASLKV